ncbi:hypothetical protein C8J56DRAFT_953416 [Mycena floridula]|nr:hypothetical protein C8J56DRAFT_953416 [Mycena floridula]
MADPQASPISQLLVSLGLTREDLNKRSDQMRQFLTAEGAGPLRVFGQENTTRPSSPIDIRSRSLSSVPLQPLARSTPLARSSSVVDASVPSTPTPSGTLQRRQTLDTMESVIERQSQTKKGRHGGKDTPSSSRASMARQSPAPRSSASTLNSDHISAVKGDDESFFEPAASSEKESVPASLTNQQSKYYREHTATQVDTPGKPVEPEAEPDSPVKPQTTATPMAAPQPPVRLYAYPQYTIPYYPVPIPKASSSNVPVTPQHNRVAKLVTDASPLPPSSPPAAASSPQSSPVAVNLVSSPGPMGPAPKMEDHNRLPYTLPPGPYTPTKPECSYAAILGQAILSSPQHRLTLQEIYDWITIVFPFFKRGETTWMNSIRHVLSTTICFRKVTRDRAQGRTQWAIWDEDLECFKNGGFKKQYCQDMNKAAKAKPGKRARKDSGDEAVVDVRKTKKVKKGGEAAVKITLPPAKPPQASTPVLVNEESSEPPVPSSASSPSLLSSLPELIPNESSSSSPPPSSDMDLDAHSTFSNEPFQLEAAVSITGIDDNDQDSGDEQTMFGSKLNPVQSWDASPSSKPTGGLKKGIQLKFTASEPSEDSDEDVVSSDSSDEDYQPLAKKGTVKKQKTTRGRFTQSFTLPPSPTPVRRGPKVIKGKDTGQKKGKARRLSSPPAFLQQVPCIRQLSHRGLHMSPSPSLAHYKSHLDPPPPLRQDDDADEIDPMRTPSRKRPYSNSLMGTPRKLVFPGSADSPFRTPGGILSPFRLGGLYDPQESSLLDDELHRMGEQGGSPAGLFGGRGSLLYDSPNNFGGSPSRHNNHWW